MIFGEKEPFDDKSETHGICPVCYPKIMAELQDKRDEYNKLKKGDD
jgi:hypothetical protein